MWLHRTNSAILSVYTQRTQLLKTTLHERRKNENENEKENENENEKENEKEKEKEKEKLGPDQSLQNASFVRKRAQTPFPQLAGHS